MNSKPSPRKRKIIKYIVVLAAAMVLRILLAFFAPMEIQKYVGLIIIIVAIATFFTWDYLDEKGRRK